MSSIHGRTIAIVNLRAGCATHTCHSLSARMNHDVKIVESQGNAETPALAAAEQGAKEVIAVGGDGTIHQVLNGILASQRTDVTLGVAPCGSANDFAVGLRNAITRLAARGSWSGKVMIDVGLATAGPRRRYFCNVSGVGLTARIAQRAERLRHLCGRHRYLVALLQSTILDFQSQRLTWQIDHGETQVASILAFCVMLGSREGGFTLARHADPCSKRFHLLEVRALRRIDLIRYLPGLLSGKLPERDPRIVQRVAQHLAIQSEVKPLQVHLDGEPFLTQTDAQHELQLELVPSRIEAKLYEL